MELASHHSFGALKSSVWCSHFINHHQNSSKHNHQPYFQSAYFVCQSQWLHSLGLQLLACWDYRFESHWQHRFLCLVSVVCSQVVIPAMGWSLIQRSPTECGVSKSNHEALKIRRSWPTWARAHTHTHTPILMI